MALIDTCYLWHKLENSTDNSEIGVNPAWGGTPTFGAVKFGNGFTNPNSTDHVEFANVISATAEILIDFWYKPNYNSSSASVYRIIHSTNGVVLVIHGGANIVQLVVYSPVAPWTPYSNYRYTVTWSAGDLIHFLVKCDNDGGFHNKLQLWINGVEISPFNYAQDGTWTSGTVSLLLGRFFQTPNGGLDNIKLYNDVTAGNITLALANRENEGFPSGGGRLMDGEMIGTLIDPNLMIN